MSASEIVNKVWNYAHVLRDDGLDCLPTSLYSVQARGDYDEASPWLGHPASLSTIAADTMRLLN